jgi:hypothetical protein
MGQNRCVVEQAQKVSLLTVPVYVWSGWIKATKVPVGRDSWDAGIVAVLT